MTNTVTIPVALGGTGTAYNDGPGANGLASNGGYGYLTLLILMLGEVIAACQTAITNINTGSEDVNGTSVTSRTPAGGSMTWVYVETGKAPLAGMRIRAASRAAPTANFAAGTVTAYDSGTKTVTVFVDIIGGAPVAATDWNLILEGEPGDDATLITPTVTFGATGTLVFGDEGAHVKRTATSAVGTDTAAALGDGWACFFPAALYVTTLTAGSGTITANDTAAAAASKTIPVGWAATLQCDGTNFTLTFLPPGGLVLLGVAAPSSVATVDFTSSIDAAYEEYELHLQNLVPATNAAILWLRTSANAGGAWDASASNYDYSRTSVLNSGGTATTAISSSAGATEAALGSASGVSSTASKGGVSGVIRFFDPAGGASNKNVAATLTETDDTNGLKQTSTAARRLSVSAVNGLRLMFSTGNIASGKIKLYGVKKA